MCPASFFLSHVRNTPCFSYGDISHTLFSCKDCTGSGNKEGLCLLA